MKALAFGVACLGLALWAAGYHFRHQPTGDELYGCTAVQRAPNGECK
jgi:hypothetical protein